MIGNGGNAVVNIDGELDIPLPGVYNGYEEAREALLDLILERLDSGDGD